MPIRREHAPALIAGAFVAGLAIVGITLALSGGDGDDTRSIDTERSTTSSSSSTSSTSTSTTTSTLPPVTIPPTSPPTTPPPTPGTIIVVPTSPPPTVAPVTTTSASSSTTSTSVPSSTTSTTQPQTPDEQEIQLAIETALSEDGTLPPDDARRVFVDHPDDQTPPTLRVTVGLDASLSTDDQLVAARVDAFTTLQTLQGLSQFTEDRVILRLRLPDEDGDPKTVVRLVFDRDTLMGIDFSSTDPLSIFTLADAATFDPPPNLEPTPTTTTSTSP